MSIDIHYQRAPDGVAATATWTGPDGRRIQSTGIVRAEEMRGGSVEGRFGDFLKKAAKNKALRGIAKAAGRIVRSTPYGAAAMGAVDAVRGALGRGGQPSRSGRSAPSRVPSRRTSGRTGRTLNLSAEQRLVLVRRLLHSGLRGRSLWRAVSAVIDA